MKISAVKLKSIIQEELEEFGRKYYIDDFLDDNSKQLIDKSLEILISKEVSTVEILEYFRTRIDQLKEMNTTGTGASMKGGQGGQYATPKAFKDKRD